MRQVRICSLAITVVCGGLLLALELDEACQGTARWAVAPSDDYAAIMPSLRPLDASKHLILWTTLPCPNPDWADTAEDAVQYASRRLGVKPTLRTAVMFVVRDHAEVTLLARHLAASSRAPVDSGGLFIPAVPAILIRTSPTIAKSIVHETIHYVVRGVTTYIPPALNEGLAVFLAEEFLEGRELLGAHLKRKRRSRARVLVRELGRVPPLRYFLETGYSEFHGTEEVAAYHLSWCQAGALQC